MTPGGSFFEEMVPSIGVMVKEGGKNKCGKQGKKSITRSEYMLNGSKSQITLPSILDKTVGINNIKNIKVGDSMEMSSTLQTDLGYPETPKLNLNLSSSILPPLENSRFSINSTKNKNSKHFSFSKPKNQNKISMKDSSSDFIEQSLIIRNTKNDRILGVSKSSSLLKSSVPDK